MATLHFIMQGKGGVGKSLCASLLTQYLAEAGSLPVCFDTDPVNNTFAGYQAFGARIIEIMAGDSIDPRGFDALMEALHELGDDVHAVIDNGAASFVPLGSYLAENDAFSMLIESGHHVFLHTVITGGQALPDTLDGLTALASVFDGIPLVVWLNEYFGSITLADGRNFEQFMQTVDYQDRLYAQVQIPNRNPATFGKDLSELFAQRRTFSEALADSALPLMQRQRYRTWWTEMSMALDNTQIV